MIVHGILHRDMTVKPDNHRHRNNFAQRLGFVHL